jgi:plastocyanin
VSRCVGLAVALSLFLPSVVAASEPGQIHGAVKFPGETPPPFLFTNRQDHDCPHGIAANHLIVKQTTLGLKNALVVLEAEENKRTPPQSQLLESGCVLKPRVQVVTAGTSVQFKNGDAAPHQLHIYRDDVSVYDVPILKPESAVHRPFVNKGLYKVNCDKHLWERAWIYVSDHPYAAVTDANGEFTIENVPPGHYRIHAWHEGWKEKKIDRSGRIEYIPMGERKEIVVHGEKTTDVVFDQMSSDTDSEF